MWFFLFDPLTFVGVLAGYILMFFLAASVAPKVAGRLSGRFSLYASMAILLTTIIVVFSLTLVGIVYAIQLARGAPLDLTDPYVIQGLVVPVIAFVVIANVLIYLISPYMINIFYGARHDKALQDVVNRAARRLGFSKAPKAVVVRGPPNAFAYGNILAGRYVAVTEGMLQMTDEKELEAVIGHELGHHKHRDNAAMLFLGILPSVIYFLGVSLIRLGFWGSYGGGGRRNGSGGIIVLLAGLAAVMVSFLLQVLILAFSRLREYYADLEGARAAGRASMQSALAKLHIYYNRYEGAREEISSSKIKALFIYALTEAVAQPFYRVSRSDIERIMRSSYSSFEEIFSSHPPIPKRLKFLEDLSWIPERL